MALDNKAGRALLAPQKTPRALPRRCQPRRKWPGSSAAASYDRLRATAHDHLGPDHPHTLIARNDLARWRGEAGDVAGAVTAFAELVADHNRILGPDHPDTLTNRADLAHWQKQSAQRLSPAESH
ncbi:tetratricopeptide repeat protein [Streptomyces roseoverticillatus]|uniref:Tetratricopeptide repeat protein n=1 Tax=Streptomyces roseoverticillatus TaxID=66429 RepID=A0ABV3J1K2_9ACTN